MVLAILQGNDTYCQNIKRVPALQKKALSAVIKDLRKGDTVTSKTQESQNINALNKYAKNLNEMARQGKLDPGNWA